MLDLGTRVSQELLKNEHIDTVEQQVAVPNWVKTPGVLIVANSMLNLNPLLARNRKR